MNKFDTQIANWRSSPFLRLLLPFTFGILISDFLIELLTIWELLALVSFLSIAFILNKRLHFSSRFLFIPGLFLNLILVILGVIVVKNNDPNNDISYYGHHIYKLKQNIEISVEDFTVKEKWIKVSANALSIEDSNNRKILVSGKLLVYLEPSKILPAFGQVISLNTQIIEIQSPVNPHTFNYKQYLANKNVYYQAFCKEEFFELKDEYIKDLNYYSKYIREILLKILKKYLGTSDEYSVASALLFGYRDAIDEEINNAYIQTGAIHILAVSGLHVGILSGLISFLLGFIRRNNNYIKTLKLIVIISFIWAFVFIAGASGSIVRAAVMFTVLYTGSIFLHRRYIYNALAASAFLILMIVPKMLYDVGFQLSYVAVIGIISMQDLFKRIWKPKNAIMYYAWELVSITISAQIATLPIVIYYFHQTSLYFLISGLIVVPLSSFAMYAGIILFFTEMCIPVFSHIFGIILYYSIYFMNVVIFWIQSLEGNLITDIPLNIFEFILMYGIILFGFLGILKRNKYILFTSLFCLLIFSIVRFTFIINATNQKQLFFYSSKNTVYIDCFMGQNCIQIGGDSIIVSDKYISEGNRIYHRICNVQRIDLGQSINLDNFAYNDHKLVFFGKQFFFLKNKSRVFYGIDTSENVYVLNDVEPFDFLTNKKTKMILLNPNMPYKLKASWIQWAILNKIKYIDLKLNAYNVTIEI